MNPRSSREEALFALAVDKSPTDRAAFLDRECGGDASLRQRLEALLAAHEQPETLLATQADTARPTIKLDLADAPDEAVGQTLGRYKLLEQIGEGGCGVVYVAEQKEPVRRKVALKVIKLGMDTKQVVARFEAERQALAMMDHPNIAKVLDAGTTDVGRPYFVMELVRGIRITDYCDQANLSTKERLDLFIKVCHAIQHAHQKGIIHRDIKPSNILVTLHDGVPVPKVIDFGIAKATQGELTDKTIHTQFQQFIGTPAYMSPEQAELSGLDIDTRSDIYSLGVLLYELLAGSTPFDAKELMASGIDKMRKTIREKEPQRPSTRLATLGADELTTTAKRRSADTAKLLRQLKGDLDWIVMKCLEKDRQRRYETANGLAADLKRHLNNEPVVARPPSAAYKFQKSWHRNRVVYSASFAVAFALSVGLGVSIMQALRATREKRNAVAARVEADRNATDAIKARELAEGLKRQADAQALASRRRAYASDMLAAQKALAEDNLARTQMLLNRHRPTLEHEVDLRGWEWRYLWSQAQPDSHEILISGSGDREMFEIGFAGDAQRLGFWENGEIKILDLPSRQTRSVSSPAAGEVQRFFAFAHRHPWVFFATAKDGKITQHLYDFEAHKELIEPQASDGELLRSQFAPDDSVVIAVHRRVELINGRSVNRGNRINAIDVATGATLWTKPAPSFLNTWIHPMDVSPDGKAVAVIAPSGLLRIYELRDGRERFGPVTVAKEIALTVRFSPDSKSVLTTAGFGDTEISIWNAEDGTPAGRLEGHRGFVSSLVFTPDGRRLISGAGDYTIRTWDWDNRRLEATYRGHSDEVDRIALSPDGHTLVSECKDGSVYLWNLQTNEVRHAYRKFATAFGGFRSPPRSIEFMSDHRSIMALYANGQRQIWDLERLEISSSRRALPPRSWNNAPPPTYSPDGNQCARNLTNEQVVAVMDANTTREIARLPIRVDASPGGSADPGRLRYSTDGRMLVRFSGLSKDPTNPATNGRLQRVEVWSTSTWKLERQFDLFTDDEVGRIPFDNPRPADNPLALEEPGLFAFISRGYIDVVDVKHPEPRLRRFSRPGTKASWIEGFVVSRERNYAATTAQDGYLTVWDWDTGEVKQHFKAFRLGSHGVSRSQDGRRLAASSGGLEAVKIWDTESWDEVTTLGGEGSLFRVLKFSPDGRHIFAGSGIGGHLWTAPTMEEIEAAEAKATQSSQRVVNPFPAPKAPRQQPTQEPKNPGPLIRAGKYAEAAQAIREVIKAFGAELDGGTGDGGTVVRVVLAATLLAAGDRDGYRAACAEAVSRFRNATNSTHAGWIARTCLLAPDSGVDAASLAALMATAQSDKDKHWLQLLNALAEYRLGRWNTAADWAVQARTNADAPELCTAAAAAILAMAEHQQKRPDEARVALEAAKTAIAANGPTGITANWPEWLIADLLAKEAGALINKPAAAAKP